MSSNPLQAIIDALLEAVKRAESDVRDIYHHIDQDREVKAMKRAGQLYRDLRAAIQAAEEPRCTRYRPYRGGLAESMAERVPCASWDELLNLLGSPKGQVKVTPYAYDERIEEDTHTVTVDGNVVGFTDGQMAQSERRIVNGVLIDEFPELTWAGCKCKDWARLYIPEDRGDLGHHPRCTAVQDFAKQPCAQDPKCQGADTDGHCVPCAARKVLDLPGVFVPIIDDPEPVQRLTPERGGDWPEDASHENGRYQSRCRACGAAFTGNKRRVTCRVCSQEPEGMFLLLKRGLYWRENYCGYTEHKAAAGRYMRADAAGRCHSWDEPVSMIAEADAPESSREARGFQPEQANDTQEPAHE